MGRKGALRESHGDEKKFHDEEIVKQHEHGRIQDRLDAMYIDKLDGRIDTNFFDCKAAEWRAEQERVRRAINAAPGCQSVLYRGRNQTAGARRSTLIPISGSSP
jgi:hypothetical protein